MMRKCLPATCKSKKKGVSLSFGMPNIFKRKKKQKTGSVSLMSEPMLYQPVIQKSSMNNEESDEDELCAMSPDRSNFGDLSFGRSERSGMMKRSKKTKSSGDKMMIIVSLQNFDGSWSPSSELESVLNITQKELEAKYKGNIWCTAIVVAFLEKNFSKRKSEWEMICNKAIKWLTSQDREGKSVTQIIEEANDIIKNI
ncbi:Hypothetical predicted protein [Mytilus galloprovincialis]|uniref:Uncharacterized protein n=2 Tax=Mytilus galloprovincialis TaxID=29158 RepID=A0A8B6HBU7_MYTGA|nr:Hypothetical predicted protein [Mytilus galloprovincialis]